MVGIKPHLNLDCHFLRCTGIAAKHRGNLSQQSIFKLDVFKVQTNNLTKLIVAILLKVYPIQAILERVKHLVRFARSKHECLPTEIEIERVVIPRELGSIFWIRVKNGK